MKSKLPYSTSKSDPAKAQKRIREMLLKFGVDRIIFDDNFKQFELAVMFVYKDYPVRLPVNYGKLAEMYLKEDPYTSRKHCARDEWDADKRDIAYRASFSLLEDFLKGLVTMVEMDIFSFEEIFISYFTDNQGQRLGEVLLKNLPELIKGKLALMPGNKNSE